MQRRASKHVLEIRVSLLFKQLTRALHRAIDSSPVQRSTPVHPGITLFADAVRVRSSLQQLPDGRQVIVSGSLVKRSERDISSPSLKLMRHREVSPQVRDLKHRQRVHPAGIRDLEVVGTSFEQQRHNLRVVGQEERRESVRPVRRLGLEVHVRVVVDQPLHGADLARGHRAMQRSHKGCAEHRGRRLVFGRDGLGDEELRKRPEEVAGREAHARDLVVAVDVESGLEQQVQRVDVAQVRSRVHGVLLGPAEELEYDLGAAVHLVSKVRSKALLGKVEDLLHLVNVA